MKRRAVLRSVGAGVAAAAFSLASSAEATSFTTTVPGAGISLPSAYPEAGGVVIVMVGVNGQVYYQFSDPDGAFRGFNSNGQPASFRGNPFTINDPIPLDCGIRTCTDYFGGEIAQVYIRFSAYDGDTQPGGFDENDISLIMNGVNVGSWSGLTTEKTDNSGTVSQGFQTGFGNNSFNTGWFSSSDPALTNSLLSTGVTTTQVLDDDPNDNYWDFRRGNNLSDEALRTIAPGYEFEKTTTATDYTTVGEEITYTYTITNIGSVNINNLSVSDDKVDAQGGTVTCDKTTINETTGGGQPEVATCTAIYTVTQEDIDNGTLTNVASAIGNPEFGVLGAVTDEVTLNGPTFNPDMTITKVARQQTFSAVGDAIIYDYEVENTGNTTLTDVSVMDNLIPSLSCSVASLLPGDTLTCQATYEVTQEDVDSFALNGTLLTNTATAEAEDRGQTGLTRSVDETVSGAAAAPAIVVDKSALQPNFSDVGDVLQFRIEVTNTGNVTWPAAPTITDALITGASGTVDCPVGPIAPNGAVICTAEYEITQADLDAGEVVNTAQADITVGGVAVSDTGEVTVPALLETGLTIVKALNAASPTSFDATGVALTYDYTLTNTGNVTLTAPEVTDDLITVTCPAGPIAPGASITCTSDDYMTTQEDLDAGEVTNTASAAGRDPDGDEVTSDPVELTVQADQMPDLTLDKQAPVVDPVDFFATQTVTYTYEVTNSGNTTITEPITVTDDRFPDPIECGTAALDPGQSRTCQATYEITVADENAGFVTNTATATDGTTTSNADTATVPQAGTDAITLDKVADLASVSSTSDVITYTFTVTNVGDLSIDTAQTISINDPKLSSVTCDQTQRIFPVGDGTPNSVICTGTYSPTQAEIDAGEVENSATAEFTRPNNGSPFTVTSPSATATVPVAITPSFTLDKTGPSDFSAVGETITYTFRVTNQTEQTIASATVTDPLIPGLSCDLTNIGPLDFAECTGDYVVTQDDMDAGQIDNTASATGSSSTGALIDPVTASETTPINPAAAIKSLDLSKTADTAAFENVGDQIRYTFAVANTGTQTLTDITVTDPLLGLTCTIPSLAVSTVDDFSCQAIYTVTQADLDAGEIVNSASATAPGATGDNSTLTTPAANQTAAFTIEKTADDSTNVVAGQLITYSYEVENTGNVSLSDVALTDTHTSASGAQTLTISGGGQTGPLAPGDSVTLTATYTVTQDDIDAGTALTNTVTGTGTPPAGVTAPTASDDETVTVDAADPDLRVVKTEVDGDSTFGAVDSSEDYSFEVFNDGNVTLSSLVLTDDLTGFSCTLPDLAPGGSTTVCADSTPLSTSYTVLQSDVDAKVLGNTVDVAGQAPDGSAVTASDTVSLAGPTQAPSISMTKTATSGAGFTAVGDEITYDYVVLNDGNVTLTAPISVADDKTSVTCPPLPGGGLTPGATLTCTATYAVTQADLNTGEVTNVATATVNQPVVPDTVGGPNTITATSAPQSETVAAAQAAELSIAKAIAAGSESSFDAPGDTITFAYTVTNTGNVTIPGPIQVTDDKIAGGAAQACSTAALAPGDDVTCELIWTATQEDIDAGSVTNTASPVASFGSNPVPTDSDSVTVPAVQTPEMTILKEVVSIEDDTFAQGKDVTYRYTVTNTGNTTFGTEPVINDNLIDPADITIDATFPAAGLAPGGSITYTGVYELTLTDIQIGSVTNNATATADGTTSLPAAATVPTNANPALTVEKSAQETEFTQVGDTINYSYIVTNTSPGTPSPAFANAITVTDDKVAVTCPTPAGGQLLVGESITCTAQYTVTQEDLDAVSAGQSGGFVTNVATANTVFGGMDVQSPADTVTVPAVNDPALTVAKSVAGGPDPASAEDVLTFGILTTNSGDTTLNGVEVSDPLIPALDCYLGTSNAGTPVSGTATLAPGDTLYCEGDYTVTQADIDAQELENTATASGTTPAGDAVTGSGSTEANLDPADPEVEVTKALSSSEPDADYSIVGQELEFEVTVTNTGNVTLTSVEVTDALVPGETCTVTELAPGDIDTSCTFFYIVTQDDIDQGSLTNTVNATAIPASDPTSPVEDEGEITIDGPPAEPAFSLAKSADLAQFSTPGEIITYSYVVANTGNVTLQSQPTVTDDKIDTVSCPAFPAGGLTPLDFITCTATYAVTQDDIDAGEVTNIATVESAEVPFDPTDPERAEATETVPAQRGPAFTIAKQAEDATDVIAGQTILYTYTVTNIGNVTLDDVTLSDMHTSAAGTVPFTISNGGVISTLPPGEDATLTASYTVTQADIDAGADITNAVTGTATPPTGLTPPTASDDETVTVAAPDPELDVIKTVAFNTGTAPGDIVTFFINVENTGNVTLDNIALTDVLRDGNGDLILPAPTPVLSFGDGVSLDVGEVWVYEVNHVLTQDDIDSGGLSNSVQVTALDPSGTQVSDVSDTGAPGSTGSTPTGFELPADPELTSTKQITSSGTEVGDTVTFLIEVENTGNVTMTGVAIVSDTLETLEGDPLLLATGPSFGGSDAGSPDGTLTVGETARYIATYVLTQADIDAGGIQNSAVVSGNPPTGPPVTDTSDNGDPADGDDNPTQLVIAAEPEISFAKEYVGTDATFDAVGDVLDYLFTLENIGNVTLTDPIVVDDPLIPGGVTCDVVSPTLPWAPGEIRECTASYTITQEDLDRGEFENTATATVGTAAPVTDTATVPANQAPELEIEKVADSVDPATEFFVGAVVGYTYTVTNTGNVTITDEITVNDNLIPASDITCPPFPAAGVAPGGTYICTGVYTVTSGDVDLTSVTNSATATDGNVTSPLVTETIPNDAEPALEVLKELVSVTDASGNPRAGGFEEVGDRINYRFTVENTGALAFVNDVVINDTKLPDPLVCYTATAADPDFRPGETAVCETDATTAYTVTQEDLDAGEVFNEALAETSLAGLPAPVISAPSTVTTEAATEPAFELVKSTTATEFTDLGEIITFDFTLTNTGNQTLTSVAVSDPQIPSLVCEVDSLAPGDELICSGDYEVTQADIDAGTFTNSATAEGITPKGVAVPDVSDSVTVPGPAAEPLSLALTKTATPTPFGAVGSLITYGFEVENTSKFTVVDVTVTDPLIPGFSCTIATLDPFTSDATTCTATYTVTQEDVDAGEIENTASVSADDLNGTRSVTVEDTLTTAGPVQTPGLEATKTASFTALVPGESITYMLTVANTGNVSLDVTNIADTMNRISTNAPTFLTTPFALSSGDDDLDGLLDVDEVWTYTAQYQITQSDLNSGGVRNTVTVTADGPNGSGTVSDVSDDGNDGDGNSVDDPTIVEITRDPRLDVIKTVVATGAVAGDTVVFEIVASNVGNVDVTGLTVSDTLSRADGTVIGAQTASPVGTIPATLAPGESATWQVSYELSVEDIDAGGLSNVATVSGIGPGNVPVSDVADDNDDSDGNTEGDPTLLTIAPAPLLEVTKTSDNQTVQPEEPGDVVTFDITVANTGNVTLTDVTFTDTLERLDGTALTPDSITPASLATLGADEIADVTVTYTLTQDDFDAGGIQNTFEAAGSSPLGLRVSDVSDDGDDTDGNTLNDPTEILIEADTTVAVEKTASVPTRVAPSVFEVIFTLSVENQGNVTHEDIVLNDDLSAFVAPAVLDTVGTPVATGFATGGANTGYDGVSDINTVSAGTSLLPGETGVVTLAVRYDVTNGSPAGLNTVEFSSNRLSVPVTASVGVAAVEEDPDIVASKRVISGLLVQRGSTVTYELTFENRNTTAEAGLTFVDRLPAGMLYVPDSALFNGADTPAPTVAGRTLTWTGQTLDPGETVTIQISARLLDGPGEYTNTAYVLGPSGARVSNTATATVRVTPEAVFDCSDVIGKVFDDRDGDGYQDPPEQLRGITNQDLFKQKLGKLSTAQIEEDGGEPGLPGVKLVTARGDIITTDEYGRFNVPCAELPERIGSNFLLKLDERSLPTGYLMTTENPRVMRLTAGKMVEMNFGARLGNVVEIDLTGAAFAGDEPSAGLRQGLSGLVDHIRRTPAVVHLRYNRSDEGVATARARLAATEKALRAAWRGRGTYSLDVQRSVRRLQ
ncbi:DUF7507 domain-containing protein [Aliishimia ponticola]|nr:DUF11 domain-containing protein [Aliishimia ponticola]